MTPLAIYKGVTFERIYDLVGSQLAWDKKFLAGLPVDLLSVGRDLMDATYLVKKTKAKSYREPFCIKEGDIVEPRKSSFDISPPPNPDVIMKIPEEWSNPLVSLYVRNYLEKGLSIDRFKSVGSGKGIESAKLVNEFMTSLHSDLVHSNVSFNYQKACKAVKSNYQKAEKLLHAIYSRRQFMSVSRFDLYMGVGNGGDLSRSTFAIESFFKRLRVSNSNFLSGFIYQVQLCGESEVSFHIWLVWESLSVTQDWAYKQVSQEWSLATGNNGITASCEYHNHDSKRLGIGFIRGDDDFYDLLCGLAHQARLGEYFSISSSLHCKRYR